MKTLAKNKGIIRIGAVGFAIVVLLATAAVAQTSHHKRSLKNMFVKSSPAVEMESSVIAHVEVDLYNKSIDFVIEKPVVVENWMTNTRGWASEATAERAAEDEPTLESWMSNVSEFEKSLNSKNIRLEAWMQTSDTWTTCTR